MDAIVSHSITAILGGLIGAAVTYLLLLRSRPARSAAKSRAELKEYRDRVADHFARTAGLVDQLTDSYKDVFDQLQAGAVELLDAETLREKLAHQGGEVITLNRLGHREPEAPDEPGDEGRDSSEKKD